MLPLGRPARSVRSSKRMRSSGRASRKSSSETEAFQGNSSRYRFKENPNRIFRSCLNHFTARRQSRRLSSRRVVPRDPAHWPPVTGEAQPPRAAPASRRSPRSHGSSLTHGRAIVNRRQRPLRTCRPVHAEPEPDCAVRRPVGVRDVRPPRPPCRKRHSRRPAYRVAHRGRAPRRARDLRLSGARSLSAFGCRSGICAGMVPGCHCHFFSRLSILSQLTPATVPHAPDDCFAPSCRSTSLSVRITLLPFLRFRVDYRNTDFRLMLPVLSAPRTVFLALFRNVRSVSTGRSREERRGSQGDTCCYVPVN